MWIIKCPEPMNILSSQSAERSRCLQAVRNHHIFQPICRKKTIYYVIINEKKGLALKKRKYFFFVG